MRALLLVALLCGTSFGQTQIVRQDGSVEFVQIRPQQPIIARAPIRPYGMKLNYINTGRPPVVKYPTVRPGRGPATIENPYYHAQTN